MRRFQPRQRRGAVAIEFAITVPILFLFLFIAIELGMANMQFHTTEAAAYEAARIAIIPGSTTQQAEDAARLILASGGVSVADVQFTPADFSQDTDTVACTISMRFEDNTRFTKPFFVRDLPFVRTCELNREKIR